MKDGQIMENGGCTDRLSLYQGVSRLAWGYVFLYFDIKLGTVSVLPMFAGWLFFLAGIRILEGEHRELSLLRPLAVLLAVWSGVDWWASWLGGTVSGHVPFLDVLAAVAALYFNFQLLTNLSAIAVRYQGEGEKIDRRLLRLRTVNVLLVTANHLVLYLMPGDVRDFAGVLLLAAMAVVMVCQVSCLFALRKCFQKS